MVFGGLLFVAEYLFCLVVVNSVDMDCFRLVVLFLVSGLLFGV